jgi:homoserine kinase
LYGGFVLVRVADPADVIRLPVPAGLTAVVVHPDLEIETARARELLGQTVPLSDAIRQWANLGTLVDALHRANFEQLARSLEDTLAEPCRAPLVSGLAEIKRAAVNAARSAAACPGPAPRCSPCAATCRRPPAWRPR